MADSKWKHICQAYAYAATISVALVINLLCVKLIQYDDDDDDDDDEVMIKIENIVFFYLWIRPFLDRILWEVYILKHVVIWFSASEIILYKNNEKSFKLYQWWAFTEIQDARHIAKILIYVKYHLC